MLNFRLGEYILSKFWAQFSKSRYLNVVVSLGFVKSCRNLKTKCGNNVLLKNCKKLCSFSYISVKNNSIFCIRLNIERLVN